MHQAVQEALPFDGATAWFLGFYVLAGCVLALGSLAVAAVKRGHAGASPLRRPPASAARLNRPNPWRRLVKALARLPVSPNQITVIGLLLVVANCAIFLVSANPFWFGSGLIAAVLFDMLDGQIAREQGRATRFGAYLDAVIDRYQEAAIFGALGLVTAEWPAIFLITTGSMLTSYNKARIAMEHPTANKAWPDLMERPLRLVVLCFGLIGERALPGLLVLSLWFMALATNFTALQRFARAAFILSDADDAAGRSGPAS